MDAWHVALREIRIGFRNPWAYSFLALFAVFSLALQLVNAQSFMQGYSSATSTMLILILYLLPLMTLLLGSFSLTAEKEEGSWQLLATYPLGTMSYLVGKYAGIAAVIFAIVAFGYGLSGAIGHLGGGGFESDALLLFAVFSAGLVALFLAIAVGIGTLARNRWQALTYAVAVWFFLIIGWPTLLVAALGFVPYGWIKPLLTLLTLANPAEIVRLFVVIKLGGGSALGPEYYQWVQLVSGPRGTMLFAGICAAFVLIAILVSYVWWERGRLRGAGHS